MVCPKCSIAPDDYVTGEWIHKEIDGHPRRVCRTCGYVDERKCWVSGVYCGPPEKMDRKISQIPGGLRMDLPKKGEVVSLSRIHYICMYNKLYKLWNKIESDPPKKPFSSDGCSWWPDVWKDEAGNPTSIYGRCFIHDLSYWAGYSEKDNTKEQVERFISDCELVKGVVLDTSNVKLGEMMFAGVRAGGHQHWNMPFSWGFGRR